MHYIMYVLCVCVCVGACVYATKIGMYWQRYIFPVTVSFSVPASRRHFLSEQNDKLSLG